MPRRVSTVDPSELQGPPGGSPLRLGQSLQTVYPFKLLAPQESTAALSTVEVYRLNCALDLEMARNPGVQEQRTQSESSKAGNFAPVSRFPLVIDGYGAEPHCVL